MGFIQEFKAFAMRGNVIDLAVGVIIGASFGKITTSMVSDIIMPPVGKLIGNIKFQDWYLPLDVEKYQNTLSAARSAALQANPSIDEGTINLTLEQAKAAGIVTINFGNFVTTVIDFTIMAFVIFLLVRFINQLKKKDEKPAPAPAAPTTKECQHCYTQIPIKATRCPNCTSDLTGTGRVIAQNPG